MTATVELGVGSPLLSVTIVHPRTPEEAAMARIDEIVDGIWSIG
jgi:hypothetical protein